IYTDRNGTLWFGTSIGVMYYDGTASVPVETEAVRSADSPALSSGVRTVGQDSAGRLWFGLDSGGALLYGPERRETQRIGLVERDRVVDIFTDREGNLWFGTDNGAVRADLYSFVDFNTSRGLLDNDVRWVVQKPGSQGNPSTNRDMLFATAGGVSVMEHERLIPLEGFRANIGVRTIAFDRDGAAWFATGQGAFRLSQQSLTQLNEGNGLLSDNVNWVSGAAGGSMIVFGTSKGLGIFKEGSLTAVDPLSGFDIRQVAEGPGGRLWCSTNRGVVTYDPPTGDTRLIDTGRGLADNDVRWITASHDRMFIATAAGVQSCIANLPAGDGHENLSLETVDTEPATTLFLDRDGYLWSGTVDGQVKKFVIISHQYISTVYSGETAALGGKRINSFCEDSAGHIWIATSGGVVRHTPVRVAPLARLSGEADGRPLQSQPQQGAVPASYDLPYGAGKLTLRFTGVSLDGQVRYLYRLNRPGADEAWRLLPVQQAAEREVAVSNVGNGSVTFELMALNRDLYGVVAPAAELPLNIGPPFWRHTWFYLIALSV
ncbi:MAG: ligand-binding sensor domain-containing protein, partial [Blastocatellia bacterium]